MKKAFYLAFLVPAAGLISACSTPAAQQEDPRSQVRSEIGDVLENFVVPESAMPTVYKVDLKGGGDTKELENSVKTSFTGIPMLSQGWKVKSMNLKYVSAKNTSMLIQIDRTLSEKTRELNRSASIELTHEDGSAAVFTTLDAAQRKQALYELDLFSRILAADNAEVFAKSITVPATTMINVNTKQPAAELNEAYIAQAPCSIYKVALRDIYSGKNISIYVTSDNTCCIRQIVFPSLTMAPGAGKVTITAPDYALINGVMVPATLDINGTVYKLAVKESQVTLAPGYELPAPAKEEEPEEAADAIDKDAAAEDSAKEEAEQAAEEKTEEVSAEETPAGE